jgi:periplasmic mercuric ion binding protein
MISKVLLLLTLSTSVAAKPKNKKVTISTSIYCDHCSRCESCKTRVENKVYELGGIKQVSLNPGEQTITVVFNPKKITIDKIRQQIASAGYDADDVKATAEQVNGLDDCCKKQQ